MHYERYKELLEQYKISRTNKIYDTVFRDMTDEELSEYDVVINYHQSDYGKNEYYIAKHPGLSSLDLAIICDEGKVPFGHHMNGNYITIYTD